MFRLLTAAAVFTLTAFASANAADLPVKAPPRPIATPSWWVSGGALLWSVKSAPLPATLTTFAAGTPSATTGSGGELGVAGTTVLSPDHLNYGPLAGGRFTIGHWLGSDPRFGVEVDGFFLGSNSTNFSETSNGSPPLRVPFFNVTPGGGGFPLGSSSFFLADPGFASGSQTIHSSLQLWGIAGDGLYHAVHSDVLDLSWIAGFRYIDLREGLSIVSTETIAAPGSFGTFVGTDNFSTRNQFFGVEVGLKAKRQFGQFDGSVQAKVALGDNHEAVSVGGFSSLSSGAGAGTYPAGIFAQATNIGQQTRNQFAVAPELQLQAGYTLSGGVRLFVGYDLLYISNVVRPGNQIDTTLNFAGNQAIEPRTTLTGPARPQALFNGSSFWAQGLRVGASYAF